MVAPEVMGNEICELTGPSKTHRCSFPSKGDLIGKIGVRAVTAAFYYV